MGFVRRLLSPEKTRYCGPQKTRSDPAKISVGLPGASQSRLRENLERKFHINTGPPLRLGLESIGSAAGQLLQMEVREVRFQTISASRTAELPISVKSSVTMSTWDRTSEARRSG